MNTCLRIPPDDYRDLVVTGNLMAFQAARGEQIDPALAAAWQHAVERIAARLAVNRQFGCASGPSHFTAAGLAALRAFNAQEGSR